ncbi:MAG: hypothetical protein V4525_11015 [Pseudomonadota bacterium]
MNIPATLVAGDSSTWLDVNTRDGLGNSIQSSAWALHYALRGVSSLDITSTPTSNGWSTSITTAQSADLAPGSYSWQSYVTRNSERITLGEGRIEITPNIATASAGFDGRSQAEIALAAVSKEILTRAQGGASIEYTIGNRQLKRESITVLLQLQASLNAQVSRERQQQLIAQGQGDPRTTYAIFTKAQ